MKSAVVTINNIYSPKQMAKALWKEIMQKIKIEGHSIGLLFCDGESEPDELSKHLHDIAGFDFIGVSAVAAMDNVAGYCEISSTLLVITGEDILFNHVVSGTITEDNAEKAITQAYEQCKLYDDKPEMVMLFMNAISGPVSDAIVEAVSEASGNIPVFGGIPTSFDNNNFVYLNGKRYTDKAVLITVSGNIKPLFIVKNVTSDFYGRKFKATKTEGRVLYEVDEKPFTEYLEGMGIDVASAATDPNGVFFHSNPIYVEKEMENGEILAYTRVLESIDLKNGSATIYSTVPSYTTMSLVSLRIDDIENSAAMLGLDAAKMVKKNRSDDYEYSTAICISCFGRYMTAAAQHDVETKALLQHIPAELNLAGFYSYGEICPITAGEKMNNLVHNCSVTLCIF